MRVIMVVLVVMIMGSPVVIVGGLVIEKGVKLFPLVLFVV
jgi:hypothetical protein